MKRFLSLLLAISVVMSFAFSVTVSAQSYKEEEIKQKAELLQHLGIITSIASGENAKKPISRAEFAVTAASVMGLDKVKSPNRYFIDVPEDHWAANSINALTEIGILSQPQDNLFRPYDSVKINEAVKIMVSMCGYSKYAMAQGGYPNGFAETARMLELDIYGGEDAITYNEAYVLIYNALCAKLYELESGTDSSFTLSQSDETLLSKYFDIYKITGQVTQAQGVSIYPDKFKKGDFAENAGYVVIDDELYTSDVNLYDYLGRFTTVFYVQADRDDTPHIIFRETYKKEGEILEISSEDFIGYEDYVLEYYKDGGKKEKIDIAKSVIVVKNGEPDNENLEKAININKGTIRLIDRDDDLEFDYVIVSEYENIVVNIIDSEKFNVYDKIKKDKFINLDPADKMVFIEDNAGAKKAFADITTGSVLTVYDSEEYVRVIINPPAVNTKVYGTKTEDDKYMVELGKSELDRTWYEIDKDYYNAVFADSGYGEVRLAPGNTIDYYTDAYGKVAYIAEPLKDSWGYAYLIRALNNEDTQCAIFKMFTQEGKMVTVQVSEKVRIDGEKASGYEAILAKLDKVANYGKVLVEEEISVVNEQTGETEKAVFTEDRVDGQVIRVRLNADNEVIEVDTERKTDSEEKYTLQRTLDYGAQSHWWHAGGFPAAKTYYGSNTVRFCVPVYSAQKSADDKYFSVRTAKYNDTGTSSYTIEGFKTDLSSPYAAVITDYIAITTDKATTTEAAYLVDKVTTAVSSTDDIEYVLHAYATTTGDVVKFPSDAKETFDGLQKGDLVQLKIDAMGNTVGYKMLYDYMNTETKTPWGHITNNGSWRESERYYDLIHTYVKTNQEGMLRLVFTGGISESDMRYENLDLCDRFVGYNAKGPMLIFDGKNVTVTTLGEGILSAEITGTEGLEDYWFSLHLAKIVSGVVYREVE